MYVSTTSESSRVGTVVFSPHFRRQFSSDALFFKLQPSREYFSLSKPVNITTIDTYLIGKVQSVKI